MGENRQDVHEITLIYFVVRYRPALKLHRDPTIYHPSDERDNGRDCRGDYVSVAPCRKGEVRGVNKGSDAKLDRSP